MRVPKQAILTDRVRRPPSDGWSWIDRRFFREYAERLEHDTLLLYLVPHRNLWVDSRKMSMGIR